MGDRETKLLANTIGTTTWRSKYAESTIQQALRRMLVAEKICSVDRSGSMYIYNPYGSTPTTTIQSLGGTYSVSTYTTTNDTLTVSHEFAVSEHIYDYEKVLSNFDLFASRINEMTASVAAAIDSFVLNNLCEDASGTYSTPSGGFTTAANINEIFAKLAAKVAGYTDTYKGLFIVLENSDISGVLLSQATNGYTTADQVLTNGYTGRSLFGIDIYVTRDDTFSNAGYGGTNWTNSGHRVFGVKGVSTYAAPSGIKYAEKDVTATTGKEIVVWGYCGFKLWYTKTALVVDITVTA